MKWPILPIAVAALLAPPPLCAQDASSPPTAGKNTASPDAATVRARCEPIVARWLDGGGAPGISVALVLPDGAAVPIAAGFASVEADEKLTPAHRLAAGSVGKTWVGAAILRLVQHGRLDLDDKLVDRLPVAEHAWLERVPNFDEITLHQLLRHESGLPRYVFGETFWEDLLADADRNWTPEDCLAYVFDAEPLFRAGKGWAYSDTNYLLAGLVLERELDGTSMYDHVREHLLDPLDLDDTRAQDTRRIPGLSQGYTGLFRQFGVPERVLDDDGAFVFTPTFEWCGGGFVSTPLDLARWARALWSGQVHDEAICAKLTDAVAVRGLGPNAGYGIATIVRETTAGPLHGHDGVFPGYQTSMGWFPDARIAAAAQVNRDGRGATPRPLALLLVELVEAATRTGGG